jgi:flagellar hook-associated protein 1 FlgK
MADMLATGVSGLVAFQRALDTTSHNIANANTPGYSRQQVEFVSNPAEPLGGGWLGTGVNTSTVRRLYDQALAVQAQSASSGFQQLDTLATYASKLDNLFSDSSTGLAATLQGFMNAVQGVADAPADISARQVLLSQAQTLTDRLKGYTSSLNATDTQVASQLGNEAATVTTLASSIASLNKQIVSALGINQQPPNDLLDQRDQLISQLATHVNVTTVAQSDGAINVFIGTGQSLVMNGNASSMGLGADQFGVNSQRLLLRTGASVTDVTDSISGGNMGGLLQFRSQMLLPARNVLGQVATALASQVNGQQAAGLDLQGQVGGPMFNIGGVTTVPSTLNAGSATATVTRGNVAAITSADYQLLYDGTAWTMTRSDTGANVPLAGAGSNLSPFTADGLSIVIGGGTPQAGDRFLVQPTASAVSGLSLAITQPEKVAAAAQLLTSAASSNAGSGTIDAGTVTNTGAWTRGNYTLTFTAANAWKITDSSGATVTTGAYTAGQAIAFNGMRVAVSGAPATNDSFSIKDNAGGTGDNRNALAMASLLGKPWLNGGTASLSDTVGRMIGDIGVQTGQAQSGRDAQQVILQDANSAYSNLSGVNLDEEAANLVKFQQAYQAAAKVIAVSNSLFQSLLDATR